MSDSIVTKILDFPIGRYPLVMYSMIAITTGIIAYATVKSEDESTSSDESASDDDADADADADEPGVFGNLADALPTIPNVFKGDEDAVKEEVESNAVRGGKNRKQKKTKSRRHRQRKRTDAKNTTKRNRTKPCKK
jgi:hypothetical protein